VPIICVRRESLSDAGERVFSTLGFAANMLAGPAYLIWTTIQVGGWSAKVHLGQMPPALVSLSDLFDTLLFVACALTYLATAAFSASFERIRWLGRGATRVYVASNVFALLFLVIRGISFPDPGALSAPWYTSPGFVGRRGGGRGMEPT
jgi:hypothetical protein